MEVIKTSLPYLGVMSSEIGGRKENQDTCGFAETPRGLLLVVCDGMGGGPAGKTASVIATSAIINYVKSVASGAVPPPVAPPAAPAPENSEDTVESDGDDSTAANAPQDNAAAASQMPRTDFSDQELLENAVKAANYEMRRQIQLNPALSGMGTTVAAVLINKDCATIAHVGDSRIYQIRGGSIVFRTADHSRVGEMVRAGALSEEQARLSAYSNIITRALGIGDEVDVEIDVRPYEKDDRFILCTDGIWGAKPQNEMVKLFMSNPRSLEGTMDVLNLNVENAGRDKGGKHDNYSAIIIETKINSTLKEKMSSKVKTLLYGLCALCGISIIFNIILLCCSGSSDEKKQLSEDQISAEVTELQQNLQKAQDENTALQQTVERLQNEIDALNGKVTDAQKKADAAVKEADKKAQQSVSAPAQKEEVPQAVNAQAELKKIIAEIKNLGVMPVGDGKKQRKDEIVAALESIKGLFPEKDRPVIDNQIELLNKQITYKREPEDKPGRPGSKGHCDIIASNLEKLITK